MTAGRFDHDRLPDPLLYFVDHQGLELSGRGRWRTTRCDFHGGSDSLRINTQSGGWICMACAVKGGDVLAYHMQMHGLEFVDAARALGAWVEDGRPDARPQRPRAFSARDALEVIGLELNVCFVVIADARSGTTPSEDDWQRFLQAAGRVQAIATEAAA